MLSKVALAKVDGDLYAAVGKAVDNLGITVVASGDCVLIKPNLVHTRDYGVNDMTSPAVIEAVTRYCLDCGAKRVIIGEGPGSYNAKSELTECFVNSGVTRLADKLGVAWVLFDDHKYRTFQHVADCTPEVFRITEYVFNCDKLINLPVLKTHYLTQVTLAMKNLKGCLKYEDKQKFHGPDLERAIVELNKLIRPTFNIIDGTWQAGSSKLLIAGTDIVAVDAVGCALMGIDPLEVRTVKLGRDAGLGEAELASIDIVGADLKGLKFKVELPRQRLAQAFPLLEINGAEKACSGCIYPLVSTLLDIAERNIKLTRPMRICVGKSPKIRFAGSCLLVGDCTQVKAAEAEWVGGCPPDKESLLNGVIKAMGKLAL